MPPPFEYDDGHWNSLSHQTPSRSPSSGSHAPFKTVVEPTEENQRIYNQTKAEQSRPVQSQPNDELLSPPIVAPAMARSGTSESYASSNCSAGSEDPPTPAAQELRTTTSNGQTRRQRGRRNRPLDSNTRFHTALKRKLRLTCDKHRQKKTTCDCYDFSKLEEAYRRGLTTTERRQHRLSHSSSSNSRPAPYIAPRESLPATTTPFDQHPEHSFLLTGGGIHLSSSSPSSAAHDTATTTDEHDHLADPLPAVPRNIERIVSQFDTASVYLEPRMVAESAIGRPYLPGSIPAPLSSSPLLPQQQYEPPPPPPLQRSQPQPQYYLYQYPQYQQQQHDNLRHHQSHSNAHRHRSYSQQLSPYSYQRTTETTMPQYHQYQYPPRPRHRQQQPQQPQQEQLPLIPIGSQMIDTPTLWKCEYQTSTRDTSAAITTATTPLYTTTAVGDAAGNGSRCPWTGSFQELRRHFEAAHHAVREAEPEARMSVCRECTGMWPGWNLPGGCLRGCSPYTRGNNDRGGGGALLQQWYYGCYSSAAATMAATTNNDNEFVDGGAGGPGADAATDDGNGDDDRDGDLESLASGYSEGAYSWNGGGGGGGGGRGSWWGSISSAGGGSRGG